MGLGNLSITRADGASAVRPHITEKRAESERSGRGHRSEPTRAVDSQRGAERTKLRSRSSEEGSLTLTTAEGDKVTISFQNKQSSKIDQAKLYGPDGSYEKTQVETRESSSLSVSLEGELSEAELKDITDLVAKLSSGIQSVRGGDLEHAQQQVSSSNNLSSIESYSFAYQQSSSLSFKTTQFSVTA